MKFKFFFFCCFFQLIILPAVRAQVVDHELDLRCKYTLNATGKIQYQSDSSSSKISVAPIVAFGLGGLIAGVTIGAHIDQGGPFEITKAEKAGAAIGTAVAAMGYVLAKRKQNKGTGKVKK